MPLLPAEPGYARNGSLTTATQMFVVGKEDLDWSTNSPNTDNAFSCTKVHISGSSISGGNPAGRHVINWRSRLYDQRELSVFPARESNAALAARFLASTNPTRPEILLPVAIFELPQAIRMIARAGELLHSGPNKPPKIFKRFKDDPNGELGAQYLAYNFGWKPLISDLKKMVSFSDSVAKRQKEFDRIYSSGGLKRRMELGVWSVPVSRAITHAGAGFSPSFLHDATGESVSRVWGTTRWLPTLSSLSSPLRKSTPHQIRQAILGLRGDQVALNIWEALPWSWLIDYFTNVGDILGAQAGRTTVTHSAPCIMVNNTMTLAIPALESAILFGTGEKYTISPGVLRREQKTRSVSLGLSLSASVQTLSAYQVSILTSIVSTRATRPR